MTYANKISISKGTSFIVEPGAMAAYGGPVKMSTSLNDPSMWNVVSRSLFGGETLFQNTFSAQSQDGWIVLDGGPELAEYTLSPKESLLLTPAAFVARDQHVELSTRYGGVKGYLSGIGVNHLTATNTTSDKTQRVFFNCKGGSIKEINIDKSEGAVQIDDKNLVAYTSGLSVFTTVHGGLAPYLLSGERLVNTFSGTGSVFIHVGQETTKEPKAVN